MSSDPYGDSSVSGRRSPPYDVHHLRGADSAGGLQIRGLARDKEYSESRRPTSEDQYMRRTPPYEPAPEKDQRWQPRSSRDDADEEDRDYWRARDYDQDAFHDTRPQRRSWSRNRSSSPRRYDRRYQDFDASDHRRSPEPGLNYRDSSPPARYRQPIARAPPSREVMLEGIPEDMLEDNTKVRASAILANALCTQIKEELKAYRVDKLDDIRIIRDKQTGKSRHFGFLTFPTLESSKAFVERNEPFILLHGHSDTAKLLGPTPVKIAFSRERPEQAAESEPEWACPSCSTPNFSTRKDCRRCGASGLDAEAHVPPGPPPKPVNDGSSDISLDNTPTQYLLFRSLAPTIGPEMLAKAAAKLYKTHERSSPIKEDTKEHEPNAKITSTSKVASSGARPGCIRRVLLIRDRRTNDSWRFGFVEYAAVDDAKAAMAKYLSFEKFTIASKPVTVSYSHAGVFVPDLNPVPGTEQFTFTSAANPALGLMYKDTGAYANVLVVSTEANDPYLRNSRRSSREEGKVKPKKRKADTDPTTAVTTTKKLAPHLQFWTKRGQELRGIQNSSSDTNNPSTTDISHHSSNTDLSSERQSQPPVTQSYADPTKHCCYLCTRQFKSAPEILKHERLSDLHKTNLANPDLVAKARAKLESLGIPLVPTIDSQPEQAEPTQEYRDRAKERRRQQPVQTSQPSKPVSFKIGKAASKEATPPPQSKAAAMMAKMGHVNGSGLGSSGSGTTAAISTNVYAAGVGLGAEGANKGDAVEVAERATKGDYASYVKDVRDKARERWAKEG